MTIYKPLKDLARRAAELAVKLARGKPVILTGSADGGNGPVPSMFIDVTTVTAENLDKTVIHDGFQTRDAVYGAGPAGQ